MVKDTVVVHCKRNSPGLKVYELMEILRTLPPTGVIEMEEHYLTRARFRVRDNRVVLDLSGRSVEE